MEGGMEGEGQGPEIESGGEGRDLCMSAIERGRDGGERIQNLP